MTRAPTRLWFAGVSAALALCSPLRGQEPPAAPVPDQQAAETLDYNVDVSTRMTVPVNIGQHGPYNFIVDTGSERTVISSELARTLNLGAGDRVIVHSMTEVSEIPTVILPALRVGQRTTNGIQAPALARRNLGAPGILGVDMLQTQRVVFDFERQEMTISPSHRAERHWPQGEIVITARRRFGRLMLVDASVDGARVYVIVDTGGQITVGNNALRRELERRHRLGTVSSVRVMSVTGGEFIADYTVARRIRIGGADIVNLPIAFADAHPFRQLDLIDRPAILLGMDALQLFERVSVDFPNRRVRLLMRDSSLNGQDMRMASGAGSRMGR